MIKDKILAILSGIGALFTAIFYVLFQQKKYENEKLKKESQTKTDTVEEQRKVIDAERKAVEEMNKEKKENEELVQDSHSGNHLDNFNTGIRILSK